MEMFYTLERLRLTIMSMGLTIHGLRVITSMDTLRS